MNNERENSVGLYLSEIRNLPHFSQETIDLLYQNTVSEGKRAEERLKENSLPQKEIERLQKIVNRANEALNTVAEHNLQLVVSLAKRFTGLGLDYLDLIQAGNIWLLKATGKYEPGHGTFANHAGTWIIQGMIVEVNKQGKSLRRPPHIMADLSKIKKWVQQSPLEPSAEEISKATGLPLSRVNTALELQELTKNFVSLDQFVNDDNHDVRPVEEILVSDSPSPEEILIKRAEKQCLFEIIKNSLPAREARILSLRLGLIDGHQYTLEEIAQGWGLTRERIRQIEVQAIQRFLHPYRLKQLEG